MSSRLRDEEGLTLIELLVVMALFGVLLTAILSVFTATQRAAAMSDREITAQQRTRVSIDRLSRWLRQAAYPLGESQVTSSILDRADEDRVTFRADLDGDELPERVRLELSGTTLTTEVLEPTACASTCTYPLWTSISPRPLSADVMNGVLSSGECDGLTADVPLFTYYERTADGDLVPMAQPISEALYSRIAAVGVEVVIAVDGQEPRSCRSVSTVAHMRNWRGV